LSFRQGAAQTLGKKVLMKPFYSLLRGSYDLDLARPHRPDHNFSNRPGDARPVISTPIFIGVKPLVRTPYFRLRKHKR
jgi:hypothetical protein